jgi:probable rRNA maturation factor
VKPIQRRWTKLIKHKIYVKRQRQGLGDKAATPTIRRCIRAVLEAEGVDVPCEISVLITDDKGIQAINNEFRHLDKPTDVLSFPMQNFKPGAFDPADAEVNPATGLIPLGDIVISAETASRHAKEYGNTDARETAYLTIHSMLHLLGYDHMDEGEQKAAMRKREEFALTKVGFNR